MNYRNKSKEELLIDLKDLTLKFDQLKSLYEKDILIRSQAEEKHLKESEKLLQETQKIARLGSFVWDLTSGLWKSSDILDEIFGIDEKFDRSFQGWLSLVHPDHRSEMMQYVSYNVLELGLKFNKEYQITKMNDGEVRWVHGVAELELDLTNKPIKLIGIILDISERKKVEEEVRMLNADLEKRVSERTNQLENANRELQAFAYSVSHDLRAPLRAIDGFSKFVLEDYSSNLDDEGKRLFGLIRSNTRKMDKLITDILALSRVARSEHKKSKIDMTKMASSMYNEAVSPEIKSNIEFIIDP